jgi:hypothetical protein
VIVDPTNTSVQIIINLIIGWILPLIGSVAVLFLIIGGIRYITSAGNKDKAETAKKTISYAVIGLVIIVLSGVIVSLTTRGVDDILVGDTGGISDTTGVPQENILTPELLATATQLDPEQAAVLEAKEAAAVQREIDDTNNAKGVLADPDEGESEKVPVNANTEAEVSEQISLLDSLLGNASSLISFTRTAEASSANVISTPITFGQDGNFVKLKNSGARSQRQYASAWADVKYGKRIRDDKNICTTYSESGCAPSALANALSKYIAMTPKSVGTIIRDNYPSYRNNYTTDNPCKSGTKSSALTTVGSTFVSADGYRILTYKISWETAKTKISENKPVIFKTTNSSFTSGGHYLVIKGKIKRKSDDKVFYWLSDSGKLKRTGATGSPILNGNGGFWVTTKTSTCVVQSLCGPRA